MTSKRTPEEILTAIEDSAFDEELERVTAMTPEQRRAELEGAGFDVEELHVEADAWADRMNQKPDDAPSPEVPVLAVAAVAQAAVRHAAERDRRRRPVPLVAWLAAAATATVVGGALYATLHRTPGPAIGPVPPEPTTPAPLPSAVPDLVAAVELRRLAAVACNAQQWSACLARLDEARAVDPDGDGATPVKTLRDRAIQELDRKPRLK
jgi:hypothetical protein